MARQNPNSDSPKRPRNLADLLSEPIVSLQADEGKDAPEKADVCYPGWEHHHGSSVRFYCRGYLSFLRLGVVEDTKDLFRRFGEKAVKAAESETNWTNMPGPKRVWDEISNNQFRSARNAEAMYFQKAALVILACELAVADALANGKEVRGVRSAADVYSFMKIVPACFNVDGLNEKYVERLTKDRANAVNQIAAAAKQPPSVIIDLSKARTVTRATAEKIVDYVLARPGDYDPIGPVRGRPGKKLGIKRCSPDETIDLD